MINLLLPTLALLGGLTPPSMAIRDLVCRGKPGIDLKITARPSPKDARLVRMTLRYDRPAARAGDNYEKLAPGACTWNPRGLAGIPREPGVVQFDLVPLAQDWFGTRTRQLDTTYLAAAFFPDTISLPRYLGRSDLYFRFFVDEATGLAISYGHYRNPTLRPVFATLTGPYERGGFGGTRSANASKTAGSSTLAKLTFRGVDRRMDGFTVRFRARPGASAIVSYSTSAPASTPSGWYFPGAAVQGSGAISRGGITAETREDRKGGAFSEYAGSTRVPVLRGTPYHFIITVQGADGPVEQYVGKLNSMRMDVSPAITDFNVTRKSFDQGVDYRHALYCEIGGQFKLCSGQNVSGRIGVLVWARPNFGPRDAEPGWNSVPGKNSGIGRIVLDTRTMRLDRSMQSFTVRSLEGEIEFEAIGELRINRF